MNGKQLKNSILQWAIQGKLVSQDPNDEPASVLLEKIRAEKARLVKEGKLKKKDLEVKPIAEDEIPFEIPKGWEWCRLSFIADIVRGGSPRPAGSPEFYGGTIPFLKVADLTKDLEMYVTSYTATIKEAGLKKTRKVLANTLLLTNSGATLGVPKICTFDTTFNDGIAAFLYLNEEIKPYVYWFLCSLTEYYRNINQGTAQPNLNTDIIKDTLFPVPPINEQARIIKRLEELMPILDKFDKAQEALEEWNNSLPEKLKKSILQEAVQGRLVPQDPTDEPASVLLERICQEKQRLVKEGKLKKKDLEVKPIEEEEIPFEIPESWEWVRLKTISDKIVDGDHNPPHGLSYDSGYYMLSSKNINHDTIECLDDVRCMSIEDWKKSNERTNLKKGDVLLTTVATLGRSCVYENDIPYCFQRSVSVIHTFIYNYFLKYCFDSPCYQSQIDDKATGTAQRGFYLNQLEESIIPLPPLAEQRRIVAKIEELFGAIKK